jgi:hypothetical protein
MPRNVANQMRTYSLPEKRHDYLPRLRTVYRSDAAGSIRAVKQEYADGRRGDFSLAEDGAFSFAVPFGDGPGVYTVVVWIRKGTTDTPIAASNVSIRVDRAGSGYAYAGVGSR